MHFLYPWMLLGALGVSVPIVIHLLNRYRFKEVEWGAMELLRNALIVRSRRIRLEDLLLLALRCLVILLVALALARPVLTPEGAPWLGRSGNVSAVIAVDASFSMGHRPGTKSRFERAADRVRDIAKTLKPGSPLTLVLMGDRLRFLLRNEGYDADRLEARLKDAAPLPERLNLDTCLDDIAQKKFIDELKTTALEFYLISDAQATSWRPLSEKAREATRTLGKAGKVFVLPVAADNSENLAVTHFDLKTGLIRKGVTVEARVANFGKQPRDVPVTLLVNDVPIDQQVVEKLGPEKSVGVTLFARIDKVGPARLTARIDTDELLTDNVRHAVVDVRDKTRVLLVRAAGADTDDKDFVHTALAPSFTDALAVDAVNWLDLPGKKLVDYQAVILANVPDLPDEQVRTLFYYVKGGGGLIVFLGDNTQAGLVNARLQHEKTPLLPAELIEPAGAVKGLPVQAVEHPLSHIIGGLPAQVVSEARVFRYFKTKLGPASRAALTLAGQPDAIVAEKSLGRGKVVLFTSAPDRAWTNMVVEPGFYPILIHEALSFVSRPAHERPVLVSAPLVVPLPVSIKDGVDVKKVTLQAQGGAPTTRDVDKTTDGQFIALLPVAEQPGFYEVRADQPLPPLVAAVNVDARESQVQTLTPDALAEELAGLPVRLIPDGEGMDTLLRESRMGRELWKDLLLLLLAALVAESLLARWFSRGKVAAAAAEGR